MKTELTSLDLLFLVRELKSLEGARVDKVYEQEDDKKDFLFVLRKIGEGAGKQMLRVKLPGLAYLTEYKSSFPERPPGFCVFLRKYLDNSRVKEVRQHAFERILEVVFEVKKGEELSELTLVCELFSKGNMVLLEKDGKIKGLLESQNWESRTIRGGTKYQYPPGQANTPKLTMAEFEKIITSTAFDSIVKTFAIELGLGGVYAEELCSRAGIPKDKKRLSIDEMDKAYTELGGMFHLQIKANSSDGEVFPFETAKSNSPSRKDYSSFNKALDEELTDKMISVSDARETKEKQTKEKKITLIIRKQEERLKELEKSISENQRKGELIYEHYAEIKELLDLMNSCRKKMGWDELKKRYEGHVLVKEIDSKAGKIVVEL